MNVFASIMLLAWIPIVVPLFAILPARRAVVAAYLAAWLFLPNGGFDLPGLPDFTKVTATSAGVLLGGLLFDPRPVFAFRPRWFDLPMLVWCLCPFFSSITNDLGVYDGFSTLVGQVVTYGLPYLIGRAYLNDLDGVRVLAVGFLLGGLIYIPFCLWEMRMSPQLQSVIYGRGHFENSVRYGGYRPLVFMVDGLEVGMWMSSASLIGYWLWAGESVKKIAGWPLGPLLALLLVTTVLCKSTGSLLLLILGLAVLWVSRRFGSILPTLALAALAPLYCGSRATGLWDGRALVAFTGSNLDKDRAQSLEFRLDNEDMLIVRALQRPVFGWGGWGRARVYDEDGRDLTITDGLWIIALGSYGIVGLTSQIAILTLPLLLLLARSQAHGWKDRDVAPVAVLAVLLSLYMIDNLSNAMFNPLYYLAAGALLAPTSCRRDEAASKIPGIPDFEDPPAKMESEWQRALDLEELAVAGMRGWHDPELAWRDLVEVQERLPEFSRRNLARAHEGIARCLTRQGRGREAAEMRSRAIEVLTELAAEAPDDPEVKCVLANALNDLAWLLAVAAEPQDRDPWHAIELASRAVEIAPDRAAYHNTMGAALIQSGQWSAGVVAVGRSMMLRRQGGSPFDFLLLAIADSGMGDPRSATAMMSRADALCTGLSDDQPDLFALRLEVKTRLAADVCKRGDDRTSTDAVVPGSPET